MDPYWLVISQVIEILSEHLCSLTVSARRRRILPAESSKPSVVRAASHSMVTCITLFFVKSNVRWMKLPLSILMDLSVDDVFHSIGHSMHDDGKSDLTGLW